MNKDNQQQTVSDYEIGWLAGLIEGEGSVVLSVYFRKAQENRKQQLRITPAVIMGNSDKAIIDKYLDILERLNIGRYVQMKRPNNVSASKLFRLQGRINTRYRDMWMIYTSGFKRVVRLLKLIYPHCVGEKKERARLIIQLISQRIEKAESLGKKLNRKYDQQDIELVLEFLKLTRSPNYNNVAGMLNEHTQEAAQEKRRKKKREWHIKNKETENEKRRTRRLRCALNS